MDVTRVHAQRRSTSRCKHRHLFTTENTTGKQFEIRLYRLYLWIYPTHANALKLFMHSLTNVMNEYEYFISA